MYKWKDNQQLFSYQRMLRECPFIEQARQMDHPKKCLKRGTGRLRKACETEELPDVIEINPDNMIGESENQILLGGDGRLEDEPLPTIPVRRQSTCTPCNRRGR